MANLIVSLLDNTHFHDKIMQWRTSFAIGSIDVTATSQDLFRPRTQPQG
jgi:hypothetical protein